MRWTHSSSERDGDEFEFDRRHIVALCDVWNCRLGQGSSSLYILQYHNGFLTFDNQIADYMVCPMAQCGAQIRKKKQIRNATQHLFEEYYSKKGIQ